MSITVFHKTKVFQPVTLTLETEEDVRLLLSVLGASSNCEQQYFSYYFGCEIGSSMAAVKREKISALLNDLRKTVI